MGTITKKSFKVRIYPTLTQEKGIIQNFGNVRYWWNYCLAYVIKWKREHGDYLNFKHPTPKEAKKETPWLSLGSSRSLQQVQRDLHAAFRNMKSKGAGFPKFKKKGQRDSYREPQVKEEIIISGPRIKLLKMGFIRFKSSRSFIEILQTSKVINVTVSRNKSGQFFASILCEVGVPIKKKLNKMVGVDLGLKEFLVSSDGEKIPNSHFLSKLEPKIKKLQRHGRHKKPGSNRYEKHRRRVARVHLKVSNQRNHFLQELSTRLINENQVICLESLNAKGMMKNHKLSKAIQDASWSKFVDMLKYKAEWYGRTISFVDRFYPSSKTCSCCGWKNDDLTLSDRTFVCKSCGTTLDRDFNAAQNILRQGMAELAKTEEPKNSSTFVDTMTSTKNYRLRPEFLACQVEDTKRGLKIPGLTEFLKPDFSGGPVSL